MRKERTLDEALDEFDKWEEKVYLAIKDLSPEEVAEYFKGAQARLEQHTGMRLNLPVRRAPQTTKSGGPASRRRSIAKKALHQ